MKIKLLLAFALALFLAQPALAAPVTWTDWTQYTTGASGSAMGTIGSVAIDYSGEVAFAQTGTGTNYWTEYSPAPYTGNSTVDNAPTASELVALSNASASNTVTFSSAVVNPIMAIVSLGRSYLPVTYDFDAPFAVLSEGRGYWGDGTYTVGAGDTLTGYELHGVIQFSGTFTSISWSSTPTEYWHGFTFGVTESAVPEPGTLLLIGSGLVGLGFVRRRIKK